MAYTNMHTYRVWEKIAATILTIALLTTHVGRAVAITYDSATTEYFETIDDYGLASGSDNIGLRFGGTLGEYLRFNQSVGRFVFTDDLDIQGTASGYALTIMNGASYILGDVGIGASATPQAKLEVAGTISGSSLKITGSAAISGALVLEGNATLSGSAIQGFGLQTDCDGATSALLWDASLGRFSCDTTAGTTYSAGQGLSLNGTTLSLSAYYTGTTIWALGALRSSGTLIWEGTGSGSATTLGGGTVSISRSGSTVFNTNVKDVDFLVYAGDPAAPTFMVDASTNRSGFNTRAPKATVAVQGTVSGSSIVQHGSAGTNTFMANTGFGFTGTPEAKLEVAGTVSGVTIYGTKSVSGTAVYATTTLASSGSFAVEGTINSTASNVTFSGQNFTFNNSNTAVNSSTIFLGDTNGDTLTVAANALFNSNITIGDASSDTVIVNSDSWTFNNNTNYKIGTNTFNFGNSASSDFKFFINGSSNNVGIGTGTPDAKLDVIGTISGVTVYATKSFSGAGLSDCDNGTTSKLLWDATTGRFSCGTDQTGGGSLTAGQGLSLNGTTLSLSQNISGSLLRFLTISGSTVFGKNSLSTSGTLTVQNPEVWGATEELIIADSKSSEASQVFLNNTTNHDKDNDGLYLGNFHGPAFLINREASSLHLGTGNAASLGITADGNVGIGTQSNYSGAEAVADTKLEVVGTISGVTVYATQSFFGAGLSDCDNGTTSKLLWDTTTGRFSCGTDQSGGAGGGMSKTEADERYVFVSGDTMTGALVIQNGNTHTETDVRLLNVRGVASGRTLYARERLASSGTFVHRPAGLTGPSIYANGTGNVGFGTDTVTKALVVIDKPSTNNGTGLYLKEKAFFSSGAVLSGTLLFHKYRRTSSGEPPFSTTGSTLNLYLRELGGRELLHGKNDVGTGYGYQPSLFGRSVYNWRPASTTTAGTSIGWGFTSAGTVSHPALATTNLGTAMRRTRWASTTTANGVGGIHNTEAVAWRGNAAGLGGFFFYARWKQNVNTASSRAFVGLAGGATNLVAAEPSAALDMIGVGFDAADATNWRFMRNDGSGVATEVDLGSNAPRDTTTVLEMYMFAPPNGSIVNVTVRNVSTNTIVLDNVGYTSDLPTSTVFLRVHAAGGPAATAAAQNFELASLYLESDL